MRIASTNQPRGRRTRSSSRPRLEPAEAARRADLLLQSGGLAAYSYAEAVVEALTLLPVMSAGQLARLCGVSWRTLQNYAAELALLEHIHLTLPEVDALGLESDRTQSRLYCLGAVGVEAALRLDWLSERPAPDFRPGRLALALILAETLLRLTSSARRAGWEAEWLPHPGGARARFRRGGIERDYAVAACQDQPLPPGPGATDGWLLCYHAPSRPVILAEESPEPLLALSLPELLAATPEIPARWLDLRSGQRLTLFGEAVHPTPEPVPAQPAPPASSEIPTEHRRSDAFALELIENQRLSGNLREVASLPERYRRLFNYVRGAVVFTFEADPTLAPKIEFMPASAAMLSEPPERRRSLGACLASYDPRTQVVVWFVHPAIHRQRAGLVNRETFLSRFETAEEL